MSTGEILTRAREWKQKVITENKCVKILEVVQSSDSEEVKLKSITWMFAFSLQFIIMTWAVCDRCCDQLWISV